MTNTQTPPPATTVVIPTGAPVTNTVANHAERPEKFNGQNFKRWQQKMFFYLTTLGLARFLKETVPQVEPPAEVHPSNDKCANHGMPKNYGSHWERSTRRTEDAGTKKFVRGQVRFKTAGSATRPFMLREMTLSELFKLLYLVAKITSKLGLSLLSALPPIREGDRVGDRIFDVYGRRAFPHRGGNRADTDEDWRTLSHTLADLSTRPDLAYAVSRLSRYTSNPSYAHWKAITRVLHYLRYSRDYGLHYDRHPAVIEGYSDANWISDIKDSRSTSGYVFTLGGAAISWKSSKQTVIAKSTMESEFIALDKCGEEAEWLRQFVEDIPRWPKPVTAISIHCDSKSAMGRAKSTMYNGKSRHIRRRHNSIRQLLSTGVISIDYVASKDNIADPFTKGLSRELVIEHEHVVVNCPARNGGITISILYESLIKTVSNNSGIDSRILLTGFPAQSVRSSNADALDSPYLLVLNTGTSQSRQHNMSESDTIPEVNPVVPEPNQVVDIHDPNEMVDIPDDIDLVDYDEEDPEEDPEEEPEEDVDIELEDDAELIFPYEVEEGTRMVDVVPEYCWSITQNPYAFSDFPRGLFESDGGWSWVLWQTEFARLKSKDKIGEKEMVLLNHDLENVERDLGNVLERMLVLESGENATLKKRLAETETKLVLEPCDPQPFKGTKGAVGLCQWFEKLESVFRISDCKEKDKVKFATATLQGRALTWWNERISSMGIDASNGTPWTEVRKWMTEEFCPRSVLQRLEQELYNLKLKGTDIDGYTNRFHELALLCPRMVEPEQVKVEQYIRGLSKNIRGDVTSSRPAGIDEAVRMAYQLMGQIIPDKTDEVSEGEKRKGEGDRGGRGFSYLFGCNKKGHRKRDCPKLKKNGQGGNNRGAAYMDAQQDPKVVTGCTLNLLNRSFPIDLM
ncbi:zinc finger, CCHC-type containing protein, partial [Tanacetum coccineum]